MAKQAGPIFFVGTIDDLVFYKLGDQYYVRRKSEPTSSVKKRLKQKASYPLMHLRQGEFGKASKLAKVVYRTLPRSKRKHGLYGKLTGKAVTLLREGMSAEATKKLLLDWLNVSDTATVQAQESNHNETMVDKERKTLSCLASKQTKRSTVLTPSYQTDAFYSNHPLNARAFEASIVLNKQHHYPVVEELFGFTGS